MEVFSFSCAFISPMSKFQAFLTSNMLLICFSLSPCYQPVHGSRHLRAADLPRGALGNSSEGAGTLNFGGRRRGRGQVGWELPGQHLVRGSVAGGLESGICCVVASVRLQ